MVFVVLGGYRMRGSTVAGLGDLRLQCFRPYIS